MPEPETKEELLQSIGGLIGTGEADITSSYYLTPNVCTWLMNDTGQPLHDTALRQQASFVGWDFVGETANGTADLWIMEEDAYPHLWWEKE